MSKKKTPKPSPADQAFTAPEHDTLGDLKLEPWTPDRIIAFQRLGGIYPNLGKEGRAQFQRTKVYPGAVRDIMLFLFLSTLPPEDVYDEQTGRLIQAGVESATWPEAKAFGVKRGLHKSDSDEFWQAYEKFFKVQNEAEASVAIPKGADVEEEEDDDPKA